MIQTASGEFPWHKEWHFKMEANPAYASLGPEAGWVYHRMRNLCGQTNNNGSMQYGAEKRMRVEQVKEWMPSIGVSARRGSVIIRKLRKSGLIKVSKAGVVTLAGWKDEQADGSPAAIRKRMSRARRNLDEILSAFGVDRFLRAGIVGRMAKDTELESLVRQNAGKSRLSQYAAAFIERENTGPGEGALVSDSGCDLSHIGSVTSHTRTKDEDEDEEDTSVSPKQPKSRNQTGSGAISRSGFGRFALNAPSPGPVLDSPSAGFPAEGDSVEALRAKYDPVEAACKLTGWHGDQAVNTFRKKLRCLETDRPGVGESIWWDCLRETEAAMAAGRLRGKPRQYLLGVANRAIERGGVA